MKNAAILLPLVGIVIGGCLMSGCGQNHSAMSEDDMAALRHTKKESPAEVAASMEAVQKRIQELNEKRKAAGLPVGAMPPGSPTPVASAQ